MKSVSIVYIVILFFIGQDLFAQNNPNEFQEEKPILLKNEASFGIIIHSNGFGIEGKRCYQKTYKRKLVLESQLVGMKHPKEIKSINPRFQNPKSFIYGKMNTLTILRLAVGEQRILYSKAERTGVEVRFNYLGGLSLGFAKPVYLLIDRSDTQNLDASLIAEKYDPNNEYQNDLRNIAGRASFTLGLDQLKPFPGLFTKAGFNFEYAPYHEDIKSLEVGVAMDIYGKEIPIMAFTKNKQIFLSFYITFIYGQKW